jgi:hypothetical protein
MEIQSPGGFTAALTHEDLKEAILAYINEQSSMGFEGVSEFKLFDGSGEEVGTDETLEVIQVVLTGGAIVE